MAVGQLLLLFTSLVIARVLGLSGGATTESMSQTVVRLAELEIDPAQLEAYKAALKQEIAASIRVEPGVLTLYAVSVKDHPTQIKIFGIW